VTRKVSVRWPLVATLVCSSLLAVVFVASFAKLSRPRLVSQPAEALSGPFVGIRLDSLPPHQQAIFRQAAEDFERTRQGLEPTCKYKSLSGFSDGGTAVYECPHYRLTVMKALSSVGGVHGYLFGPILHLGPDSEISDVRFYTPEELEALLKHGTGSNNSSKPTPLRGAA
jgi:hypothetical protein